MGQQSRQNPFGRDTTVTLAPTVQDRLGRGLTEGDLVFLAPAMQPLFRVVKIVPVLEPGAPPNLMDITLTCAIRFRAPRVQPNQEFVRVVEAREAAEQGQAQTAAELIEEDAEPQA